MAILCDKILNRIYITIQSLYVSPIAKWENKELKWLTKSDTFQKVGKNKRDYHITDLQLISCPLYPYIPM